MPQAHASGAGVEFVVEHVACVSVVGLDDQQALVALPQELAFTVLPVEVHVGEAAAIDVVTFDIVLESHHLPEQP